MAQPPHGKKGRGAEIARPRGCPREGLILTQDAAEAVAALSKYICLFLSGPRILSLSPGPEDGCQTCTSGARTLGAEDSPGLDSNNKHLPSTRGRKKRCLMSVAGRSPAWSPGLFVSVVPLAGTGPGRVWQVERGVSAALPLWNLQRSLQWGFLYPFHRWES